MKQLISSRQITIPDGVTVEVKARKVRVKGPRGKYSILWSIVVDYWHWCDAK